MKDIVDLGIQTEVEPCCLTLTGKQFQKKEVDKEAKDHGRKQKRPSFISYMPNYYIDVGALQREDPDVEYFHE